MMYKQRQELNKENDKRLPLTPAPNKDFLIEVNIATHL